MRSKFDFAASITCTGLDYSIVLPDIVFWHSRNRTCGTHCPPRKNPPCSRLRKNRSTPQSTTYVRIDRCTKPCHYDWTKATSHAVAHGAVVGCSCRCWQASGVEAATATAAVTMQVITRERQHNFLITRRRKAKSLRAGAGAGQRRRLHRAAWTVGRRLWRCGVC